MKYRNSGLVQLKALDHTKFLVNFVFEMLLWRHFTIDFYILRAQYRALIKLSICKQLEQSNIVSVNYENLKTTRQFRGGRKKLEHLYS